MRNRLARASLALLTAAASVAGITTVASAAPGDVEGFTVDFAAEGAAPGTVDAGYTLLKGNGELDFVFSGQGFAQGVYHDVDLHKGTCAAPGPSVDMFEVDPAIRETPLEISPRAIATANQTVDGTPGTLRYGQGATITMLASTDDIPTFEDDYVVIVNERGSAPADYLCGTPTFDTVVGNGAVIGTEYPYIFKELNSSGAAATGTATLIGDILSFDISYTGLDTVPSQHFQILRQSGECPVGTTGLEADMEGTAVVSLTNAPRSLLPADGLTAAGFFVSVSTTDGTLDYDAKFALTPAQADAFADSIVVIHGHDVNNDNIANGGDSTVDPAMRADETAVAGCGQFKEFAATAPEAPAAPVAAASATEVVVTWAAPDDGGSSITEYTVTLDNGGGSLVVNGSVTTATFTDLADGTYTATVVATNDIGDSAASPASNAVTFPDLSDVPGPPTAVQAFAVGQKLTVSWTAPASSGASAITGYTVTLAPGGETQTVTGLSAVFEELAVNTYVASVVANNAEGSSLPGLSPAAIIRDCQDGDVDDDWDARVVTPENGSLFRLYCGYFLRYPDDSGWDYWSGIQGGGADLILISDQFALSQEFQNTYGQLDNDQFVRLLYANVLLREVDQEGYDYWKNFLDTGELTQGGTMRWVAEGVEFQNVTGTP